MYHMQWNTLLPTVTLLTIIANHHDSRCSANVQVYQQSTQSNYHINEVFQEKTDQLKLPKDQTLIVRLPSNTLLKYTSYKDVSILHFRIPSDTRTAFFSFKAYEESKSAFQRKCKPRDVTLHLKASSYPVINPENITFPRNFLNADQRFKIYDLQFQSDDEKQHITVEGPQLGNWFAVSFISWTDPNNDRIEQQGLAASCDTLLLAELSVSRFHPIVVNNGEVHNGALTINSDVRILSKSENPVKSNQSTNHSTTITMSPDSGPAAAPVATTARADTSPSPLPSASTTSVPTSTITNSKKPPLTLSSTKSKLPSSHNNNGDDTYSSSNATSDNETIYKFYVPRDSTVATAHIAITRECHQCPDVGFHVQANAFPNSAAKPKDGSNNVCSAIFRPNETGEVSVKFYVQPNTWHYALLTFLNATDEALAATMTLSEMELLNNLKKGSSTLPLRMRATSAHAGGHRGQRKQQQLQGLRRPDHTFHGRNSATGNNTVQYRLEYSLRIDFNAPSDDTSNTASYDSHDSGGASEHAANSSTVTDRINNSTGHDSTNASNGAPQDNSPYPWRPVRFRDMEFYPLLRQTYREFFMFDYDLVPDANGTVPTVLNLTAGTAAGFAFEIGEVYDIGGTLSFAVSMKHGLKSSSELKVMPALNQSPTERSGILAEKLVSRPADSGDDADPDSESKTLPRSNQTIIVCMRLGEPGEPTWPDKCRYGQKLLPASSIVNNTDSNTSTGLIHVPFPESGQWYVTMGLYCHGAETAARATIIDSVKDFVKKHANMLRDMKSPCACSAGAARYMACVNEHQCLLSMNETETLKVKECLMDSRCTSNYLDMTHEFERHHKFATEQHFALDNCSTSVVFTISSSPCVAGRCGRFGRCYHYMSGGFVFSTCVCMKGYRGWDCTEDTQVPSSISILVASLLLTLSNLLFFPSIYMAVRRKYYTEAVIYFFAMFFSIFYHACDSGEDEYSFCLVKIGVLQFCDFYCGLLAIWVTLVAMAHIRQQFVSLLHMLGAILLAFGTELNKQSLWVFLAPSLTGICIISTSWGLRCYKFRKWFPARRYLTVYMPLGAVLVMIGLICYAFLQTKQNYHIVHSIWHMVMALSILCLLPTRKSFMPKC